MTNDFEHRKIPVGDFAIDIEIAGTGSPLLLLHGFPETKLAWKNVARRLITRHTLILPDLPGYGNSDGPVPQPDYSNYSKRAMGNALHGLMIKLGYTKYSIAGHDRGARIAYRMALDLPGVVSRLAVLNVIPTSEVADRITYEKAYNMENWFFLSQPAPFAETLINTNAEFYLNHILDSWARHPELISRESRNEYLRYFSKPPVITKMCAEYRAFVFDRRFDREDRAKNNRIHCPTLVLWSQDDFPTATDDPLVIWKEWTDDVTGKGLACGHFLMEECTDDVVHALAGFFN